MPVARDKAVTSRMMAAVRNKDSKPELALRRALHARGIRYRLHVADVLGRPDVAIRKYKIAVFVDGDMWHGHEHVRRGLPSLEALFPTNTEFWCAKIRRNMERDREVTAALSEDGWRVVRLWATDVLANPDAAADVVEDAIAGQRGSSD